MTLPGVSAGPSSWSAALRELGLDHPALMRLASTRELLERGHRVFEQRRALEGRIAEARGQLDELTNEYDQLTAVGLEVLLGIQSEIDSYSADLTSIGDRLRDELKPEIEPESEELSDESFAGRHSLRDQYDALLDMFSSFGMFDARSRTVRFQGAKGRVHQMPGYDAVMSSLLTPAVRSYLASARRVSLLLTPVADPRLFAAVGKTVGFNNYAGAPTGKEGAEACSEFVRRLRMSDGSEASTDELLRSTPFDGVRATLYADDSDVLALGLPLDATCDDIAMNASAAAELGVQAAPLSPPEYLVLQALRRRNGDGLLDTERDGEARTETWFPDQELSGAAGTLVARMVGRGLRFRSVELGRGSEGRGYRLSCAPLAA